MDGPPKGGHYERAGSPDGPPEGGHYERARSPDGPLEGGHYVRAKTRTVGLKAEAKGRAAPEATVVVPSRRDWITAGGKSRGPGN